MSTSIIHMVILEIDSTVITKDGILISKFDLLFGIKWSHVTKISLVILENSVIHNSNEYKSYCSLFLLGTKVYICSM